jgi:hypothetical protein
VCAAAISFWQRVGAGFQAAALQLVEQARDPDHEELVEVRAEDREELDALQQRVGRILRFFQHALLEFQQAELAVDV